MSGEQTPMDEQSGRHLITQLTQLLEKEAFVLITKDGASMLTVSNTRDKDWVANALRYAADRVEEGK